MQELLDKWIYKMLITSIELCSNVPFKKILVINNMENKCNGIEGLDEQRITLLSNNYNNFIVKLWNIIRKTMSYMNIIASY